jgi:alpha-L-fucosidase
MKETKDWFKTAKFGMFIHWGIYSVAGRGEWVLNRERIPYDEYIEKYANNFNAENFNPREWARVAKEAGMKYMVLTAKHHDGFCLWDTKTTDFNSTVTGPHKDIVAEYVEAVREAGLKVGLYYSPADWHHPDYPSAYIRDWPNTWKDDKARERFIEFYTEQMKELMTNYGKIDLLWYDGCLPQPLNGEQVNGMIKKYQPDILISDRNGEPYDFRVCEQAVVPSKDNTPWEACMTLNDNWGYHSGDDNYKSAKDVIKLLLNVAKDGGNLLLNVGPKGDGTIPEESTEILMKVGIWLKHNGDCIYETQKSPFSWGNSCILTIKDNKVYICVDKNIDEICVAEIKNKVNKVHHLKTMKEMRFLQDGNGRLTIYDLSSANDEDLLPVYVCDIEGQPEAIVPRTTFWIPG